MNFNSNLYFIQLSISHNDSAYNLNKQGYNIRCWHTPFPMLTYSFPFGVHCSRSSYNCCFLFCIQVSKEAVKVVWYSYFFKNIPQFVVIHTVKWFSIVNEAEVDVFLELPCCFNDPTDAGNLTSGSSAFSKFSLNIWKFSVNTLLKPSLKGFQHNLAS